MSYALPDYLTRNARFDDCPPGHRFGLYFDGWTQDFSIPRDGKTGLFRTVAGALPEHSRQALRALCARQQMLAGSLGDSLLTHPARLTAPLATGLGNEHPLENGFAFLTVEQAVPLPRPPLHPGEVVDRRPGQAPRGLGHA